MEIKEKHYNKMYQGEKLSRRVKKIMFGKKPSRKALRLRIERATLVTIKPFENSYTYEWPDDDFCPYCGCEDTRSTGNMTAYPEEWRIEFCRRCDAKVSTHDNGEVWHALMDFKEGREIE